MWTLAAFAIESNEAPIEARTQANGSTIPILAEQTSWMKGLRSDVSVEIKTLAGFLQGVAAPPEEIFGLIRNPSLWLSKGTRNKT